MCSFRQLRGAWGCRSLPTQRSVGSLASSPWRTHPVLTMAASGVGQRTPGWSPGPRCAEGPPLFPGPAASGRAQPPSRPLSPALALTPAFGDEGHTDTFLCLQKFKTVCHQITCPPATCANPSFVEGECCPSCFHC